MNNDVIVLAHTRNKVEKLTADNAALERRVAADASELEKLKKMESKLKAQLVSLDSICRERQFSLIYSVSSKGRRKGKVSCQFIQLENIFNSSQAANRRDLAELEEKAGLLSKNELLNDYFKTITDLTNRTETES